MASPKPQFQFNPLYVRGVVPVFVNATIGASGAITLTDTDGESVGCSSATKNATGDYTFVFPGPFRKLFDVTHVFQNASGIPAVTSVGIKGAPTFTDGSASVDLICTGPTNSSTTTLTATNPASGDVLRLTFWFKNTPGV